MEDNEWFGPTSRIEIVEPKDGLLVRIIEVKRKGHLAVALVVTFVGSVICAKVGSWLGVLLFLGLGVFWVAAWFGTRWGEIQVDENCLVARGKKPVRLPWTEIRALKHDTGGEYDPTGFYARVGRWKSICVMADLNREQTEEIIAAIHRRFPHLKMAEEDEPLGDRLRSWLGRVTGPGSERRD
jgi:hypothetical protein